MKKPSTLGIMAAAVTLVVALATAFTLVANDDGAKRTNDIAEAAPVHMGFAWTIKVKQDAGQIRSDGKTKVTTLTWNFKVKDYPRSTRGSWLITAKLDNSEGLWGEGFKLYYKPTKGGSVLKLDKVAIGDREATAYEDAAFLLGPDFPAPLTIDAPPKISTTVDATRRDASSALPPSISEDVTRQSPGEKVPVMPPS